MPKYNSIESYRVYDLHTDRPGLVRIHSDSWLRLNLIRSDRLFTVFHQMSYKTLFGLVRNDSHWLGMQISEWIGIFLIGSEWIPIRYLRQGKVNSCIIGIRFSVQNRSLIAFWLCTLLFNLCLVCCHYCDILSGY